jgi:peptidoglycan/xylan/chitin deacetylase (PgdA/CDA1 family)
VKRKNSNVVAHRLFLSLGLFSVNVQCAQRSFSDDPIQNPLYWQENADAGPVSGSDTQAVKLNAGKLVYIDTHDNYAHTNAVANSSQPYFKRVNSTNSIALTFDCAWVSENNGMKIIDFLKANNIRTTFFISGPFVFKNIKQGLAGGLHTTNFKMIRRIVEDGHEIANHTQTHPHNSNSINWEKEITDLKIGWDEAMKQIFGQTIPPNAKMKPYWRAPFGEYNDRSLTQASKVGFPYHFGWNVDVLDASGLPSCQVDPQNSKCLSPAKMTQRIIDFAAKNSWNFNGMVVLAHLQNPFNWTSQQSGLSHLVKTFRSKGVEFRKLSEFFVP